MARSPRDYRLRSRNPVYIRILGKDEFCKRIGAKLKLSTSHHPQKLEQSENCSTPVEHPLSPHLRMILSKVLTIKKTISLQP